MLLGGIWHGSNWTFLVWGAYHGGLLIFYKIFQQNWDALPQFVRRSAMFLLAIIGWVIFRANSFAMASQWLAKMFYPTTGYMFAGTVVLALCIAIAAAIAHAAPNTFEMSHQWSPRITCALAAGLVFCLILITGGQRSPFLYFQF
jgi:alginate O-acetyltransferase complex protein AlgI